MTTSRRLAAILAADVAGYSRLIGIDEQGTLNRLRTVRTEIVDPAIAQHHGRIVKTTGDGLLVEFTSVVDALQCATEIQAAMAEGNTGVDTVKRIELRMGINVGDVVVEDGDIFGDGVNVAARLENLADPGGICVSARVQEDAAGRLELAFDDLGEQNFKNIARPIHAYRVRIGGKKSQSTVSPVNAASALPLPDKPSIAVLPFANMSGDAEQEYFADGMVEEIITALSRIRWLFVIARNSTFTYKGQAVDVKQVGRELGVRYVLEGSVRKAGQKVRITGQLIDALTGTYLWADRFDGSLEDIFELQDKVAISVAGIIEPALRQAEIERARRKRPDSLDAYDLYLRAVATYYPVTREGVFDALALLRRATAIDPHYGLALSWAAICHLALVRDGWAEDFETSRRDGCDLARKAIEAAENDPAVFANSANTLAYFGEDIGAMIALVERALALNPSFARGWYLSGLLRLWAGDDPDLAIKHVETGLRLSPREQLGQPLSAIGMAHFLKRRFEEAASQLILAIQDHPGFPPSYRTLAACYAHMGRLDEARAIIARLRVITPQVVPSDLPYRKSEDRDLFLSGLRLAAGESQ